MSSPNVNPISFRKPPNLKGKVHPDVEQTIQDHDNMLVDLQQANASLTEQFTALKKSLGVK